MLTILSVAYPLAAVGPDAVGGAEQILTLLDAALVEAGHRSIVVACEGSRVRGELVAVPVPADPFEPQAVCEVRTRYRATIVDVLRRRPVDLVHMHGVDFDTYLPPVDVPVLATLHCPAAWYTDAALHPRRPNTCLNAVSAHQHATLQPNARLLSPIENGIALASFAKRYAKRDFALMLSRIAPEKGIHVALDACRRAGVPLMVAGALFPYPEHRRYFEAEVKPRLDRSHRYSGPAGLERKRRLLGAARCLVVCSQVPETSSLVAREAMAAGTPVVALRRGALADTVYDGRTGFIVDDERQIPEAIHAASALEPEACRAYAREHFDSRSMFARYLSAYADLMAAPTQRINPAAMAMTP